jgi:hypothetical protein
MYYGVYIVNRVDCVCGALSVYGVADFGTRR